MADFDPDAYLAKKKKADFNPDAYLAKKSAPQLSLLAKALSEQPGDVVTVETPTGPLQFSRNGERVVSPDELRQHFEGAEVGFRKEMLERLLSFSAGGGGLFMRLFGRDALDESQKAQAAYPKTALLGAALPALVSGGASAGPSASSFVSRYGVDVPGLVAATVRPFAQSAAVGAATEGLAGLVGAEPGERIAGGLGGAARGTAAGLLGEAIARPIGAGVKAVSGAAPGAWRWLADRLERYGLEQARKHLQGRSHIAAGLNKPLSMESVETAMKHGAIKPGATITETQQRLAGIIEDAEKKYGATKVALESAGAPGANLFRLRDEVLDLAATEHSKGLGPAERIYMDAARQLENRALEKKAALEYAEQFGEELGGRATGPTMGHIESNEWVESFQKMAREEGAYKHIDNSIKEDSLARIAAVIRGETDEQATRFAAATGNKELAKNFLDSKKTLSELYEAGGFSTKAASREIQMQAAPNIIQRSAQAARDALKGNITAAALGGGVALGKMTERPVETLGLIGLGYAGYLGKTRGGSLLAVGSRKAAEQIPGIAGRVSQFGQMASEELSGRFGVSSLEMPSEVPAGSVAAYMRNNAYRTLEERLGLRAKNDEDLANQAYIAGQTTPAAQPGRQ